MSSLTLAERPKVSRGQCSIARTLGLLGQKWTLLILREAMYGVSRFDDFQANLNIPRPVLSDRLALLTAHGLLAREPYQDEGQRVRQAYRLTGKGADLLPALIALMQWGDRYLADSAGPAVLLSHKECGASVRAELTCTAGHQIGTIAELKAQAGPGAKRATRVNSKGDTCPWDT